MQNELGYGWIQVTYVMMPFWLGATRMLIEELQSDEMGFYS